MMQDMAMYLLDIANNSLSAQAEHIMIYLAEFDKQDRLILSVADDGCGMDQETVKKVISPFYTTRTTRKIGLGVAFFKALAEQRDGRFTIESELGKGTFIRVDIRKSHLDTPPLGNIAEAMLTLIQANDKVDYCLRYQRDDYEFIFDTRQIRQQLDDVSIADPAILLWIRDYIKEGLSSNKGEQK
ncbi:hypothetical protein SDC9_179587 [bioreactor metagenome]|uniref:Histidine kinase domain-containing protein n=1 Tax=bioreactor metagenome TaxID=1076179 RepID=A0A645GZ76_9ZZZZ